MSEHLERLLEQTAPLRAAIPGDSPSGADISLEPEFERIRAEIDRLTSIEGGEPDWGLVVAQGEELLANKTKDLRIAVWMTVGAIHRSGWNGFARGLVVCRWFIAEMWDTALPKRDKARANIVSWLAERAAPAIEALDVAMSDGDDVRASAELVQEIDQLLADKLGDAFQGIRGLISAAKNRIGDIPVPPPTPPPPPPPKEEEETSASSEWDDDDGGGNDDDDETNDEPAPAPGGVVLATDAGSADATSRTCADALLALARSIAAVDPSRAWAYRLHRIGLWLPYERASVVDGPGPDPAVAQHLGELFAAARWPEVAVAGEEASVLCPFWLDPHRYVAIALERMGMAFNDAREVVGRDTSDFVRRHRWLLEASFADGTPAASPETVAWIELEAKRWRLGSRVSEVADDEDRALAKRFAEAKDLVRAGRYADGLAIATQLARRGASTRERFRSSLDVASLALDAGAPDIARSMLEGLMATAQAHALETWDPSLCVKLYTTLYRSLPPDSPNRPGLFEMICRLDAGAAVRARMGNGVNGAARPASSSAAPAVAYRPPAPVASPAPSPVSPESEEDESASVAPEPSPSYEESSTGSVADEWDD